MFVYMPLEDTNRPIATLDAPYLAPVYHIVDGPDGAAEQLGGFSDGVAGFGHARFVHLSTGSR